MSDTKTGKIEVCEWNTEGILKASYLKSLVTRARPDKKIAELEKQMFILAKKGRQEASFSSKEHEESIISAGYSVLPGIVSWKKPKPSKTSLLPANLMKHISQRPPLPEELETLELQMVLTSLEGRTQLIGEAPHILTLFGYTILRSNKAGSLILWS